MRLDIANFLRNQGARPILGFYDDNKREMDDAEVRALLNVELSAGRKYLPLCGHDNFDHESGWCRWIERAEAAELAHERLVLANEELHKQLGERHEMLGDMPLEEDLLARKPPALLEWVYERRANCLRIAAIKDGIDAAGWLEDAGYFEEILMMFSSREMKQMSTKVGTVERPTKPASEILRKLAETGGAIVSTGTCTEAQIYHARATGTFYVDDDGLGYVLRSSYWRKIADDANNVHTVHAMSQDNLAQSPLTPRGEKIARVQEMCTEGYRGISGRDKDDIREVLHSMWDAEAEVKRLSEVTTG